MSKMIMGDDGTVNIYYTDKDFILDDSVLGDVPDATCPFCGENDFDLVGLKSHIEHGDCVKYNNTPKANFGRG